jgi:hypothetical protein
MPRDAERIQRERTISNARIYPIVGYLQITPEIGTSFINILLPTPVAWSLISS